MSIPIDNFNIPALLTGTPNFYPEIRPLVTNATLAQVTTPGWLNNGFLSTQPVSPFSLLPIIYGYVEGAESQPMGWFQVSISQGIVTLYVQPALPGSTPWVNTVDTTLAAPGTIRSITGVVQDTATVMTSGNLVGVRGEVDYVGASGGYLYGVQGKLIPTGTLSGSSWNAAVFGQFNISAATINAGQTACLWGDYGTTSGTITNASGMRGVAITNTTAAIINSQDYRYGNSTYLLELDAPGGTLNYYKAAGTGSGSAGNSTHCAAQQVIEIEINGVAAYIPVFTQNS